MDSSSETGSDSSHLLHPETEKEYDFQRPRKSFTTRNRRPLIWSGLSILGVVLLIGTYISVTARSRRTSFLPSISWGPVTFTPDERFSVSSTGKHNPWNELIPLGKGFVRVPKDQTQGLGETHLLHNGDGEYCLSVFHQLHCVAMLRNALNSMRSEGKIMTHDSGDDGQDPLVHVDHCIDYLRQSIMCSGDMTLEHYSMLDNGTLGPGVNGYFVNHQCKNWDQIVDFATTHRSRNAKGIH
ncbi:hypothetical protein M409DRAFT_16423 [Zasmidium cellare ATCC 36951]|uniref:Oxidase ustYa n=1 Tax=Zasmidium cellare ATCC 36951 TaxID=1080233 RepID=A0A6A6D414_ZASCE|nr:uncharacterized protein M409DRAFT_16423 [Zasmidium cellare ATCC 36951]KAF2174154.1 hypothetical protein M409DRAFT_16423 [Zasmidium cellare ATCC 36951]